MTRHHFATFAATLDPATLGDVPMNVEIGSGQRRWGHG
jgi:hypothetical protein